MKPYFDRGGCTIYLGECLEVLPLLDGVGAVITDPPYSSGGAFRGDRTRSTVAKYVQTGTVAYRPEFAGDSRDQRAYLAWCSLWMLAARNASVEGAPIACFTDWRQLPVTTDAIQSAGWTWRGVAVWSKKYGRVNSAGFSAACEFLPFGSNGPAQERDDYPGGHISCSPESGDDKLHIAQKPLTVMGWACRIAPIGATILDPFMGSGSTLLAARLNGRKSIGIEVDERYCEIAAKRLGQEVFAFEEIP